MSIQTMSAKKATTPSLGENSSVALKQFFFAIVCRHGIFHGIFPSMDFSLASSPSWCCQLVNPGKKWLLLTAVDEANAGRCEGVVLKSTGEEP